jgi:hypothetical protein
MASSGTTDAVRSQVTATVPQNGLETSTGAPRVSSGITGTMGGQADYMVHKEGLETGTAMPMASSGTTDAVRSQVTATVPQHGLETSTGAPRDSSGTGDIRSGARGQCGLQTAQQGCTAGMKAVDQYSLFVREGYRAPGTRGDIMTRLAVHAKRAHCCTAAVQLHCGTSAELLLYYLRYHCGGA